MNRTAMLALATACAAALAGAVQAQPAAATGSATLYDGPNFQGRSITIYRGADNLQDRNFNDVAQSGHFDGDWTVCSDAGMHGNCQTLSGDVPNLNRYGLGRMVSSLRKGAVVGDNAAGGYGRDTGPNGGPDRGPGVGADRGPGDRPGLPDERGYAASPAYGDNRGAPDNQGYADNRGGADNQGYGDNRGGPVNPGYGDNRGYGDDRGYGRPGAAQWTDGFPGRSVVFFPRPRSDGQDIAAFDRSAADWFCRRQGLGVAVYFDTSARGRGFRFNGGGFSLNAPVLRDVVCRR